MTGRRRVRRHVLGTLVEARRFEMRQIVAEGFFDVVERDSRRADDGFIEGGGGIGEPMRDCRGRSRGGEGLTIDGRDRAIQILEQSAEVAVGACDYYFARRDSRDFLA